MSLVGIDIGSHGSTMAVACRGGVELVTSVYGGQITPTLVCYGEDGRLYGEDAVNQKVLHYESTIVDFKNHLGRVFPQSPSDDHSWLNTERRWCGFHLCDVLGGIGYTCPSLPEAIPAEGVLGSYLANLKTHLKNLLKSDVGAVISVPCGFGPSHRRAVAQAAALANTSLLAIISDIAAVSLAYRVYRIPKTEFDTNTEKCVLFIDIGHTSTQVGLVGFRSTEAQVYACDYAEVGGLDVTRALTAHVADLIKAKHHIDIFEAKNKKALVRALVACEKAKHVLSSNMTASIVLESIAPDVDASFTVTREEFECAIAEVIAKILEPVTRVIALRGAFPGMSVDVELYGGGARVPLVQGAVGEACGAVSPSPPRKSLNAAHFVAQGAALFAAMRRAEAFAMRPYPVADILPFDLNVVATPLTDTPPAEPAQVTGLIARGWQYSNARTSLALPVTKGEAWQVSVFVHGADRAGPRAHDTFHVTRSDCQDKMTDSEDTGAAVTVALSLDTMGCVDATASAPAGAGQVSWQGTVQQQVQTRCQEIETSLHTIDTACHATKDAHNALEQYLYNLRDVYEGYGVAKDRPALATLIHDTTEWLSLLDEQDAAHNDHTDADADADADADTTHQHTTPTQGGDDDVTDAQLHEMFQRKLTWHTRRAALLRERMQRLSDAGGQTASRRKGEFDQLRRTHGHTHDYCSRARDTLASLPDITALPKGHPLHDIDLNTLNSVNQALTSFSKWSESHAAYLDTSHSANRDSLDSATALQQLNQIESSVRCVCESMYQQLAEAKRKAEQHGQSNSWWSWATGYIKSWI